ncbi:hypothetical protein DAEQUDRAFT_766831 [Daedalea quercina L-15889]|uniref:Uncharacterized protein n=1 Tax=Daedalea quercina L-15889 TaxID=1314783 RepID=A0A165P7U2_9APHY|nr:hypothetical protein DAEQUDRAFT_766831 [Daedalea quercina L-15889]
MSTPYGIGPEIVPLDLWTRNNISTIYRARNQNDFSKAYDAFVADNAQVTVNGRPLSRDQYKVLFHGEPFLEQSASVSFLGSVEVAARTKEPETVSGMVGIYYKATVSEGVRVPGCETSSTINSSMNVAIEGGNAFDRKVTKVDQVITSQLNPTA